MPLVHFPFQKRVFPLIIETAIAEMSSFRRHFFVLLALVLSASLYGDFNLYVAPQVVELEVPPGGRQRFTITVINESEKATARLLAYTADVYESELGLYKVKDRDTTNPFSCADWIEINPETLILKPGDGMEVQCQIKVPRGVKGGRYAAIVFELLPEEKKGEAKASIVYHFRMPAYVELTVKKRGATRKAEITEFKVVKTGELKRYRKRFGPDKLLFMAKVKNLGDIHIFAKGRVIIRDGSGRRVREIQLGAGRGLILPQAEVWMRSLTGRLPHGSYTAEAIVDYGSITSAVAKISFNVGRKRVNVAEFKSTMPLDIEVMPGSLTVRMPPRAFRTLIFQVRNFENRPLKVVPSILPFHHTIDGEISTSRIPQDARLCVDWIDLASDTIIVPPMRTGKVKATIKIPENADPGGYYACLNLRVSAEDTSSKPLALNARVPLYMTVLGQSKKSAVVTKFLVDAGSAGPPSFFVYLKNTGDIHLVPQGIIKIYRYRTPEELGEVKVIPGREWEPVKAVKIDKTYPFLLPGDTRKIEAGLDEKLPPGKYMAEVNMGWGEKGQFASAKKIFFVK